MANKRARPEDIITKLRQVEVLMLVTSQLPALPSAQK